MISHKAKTSRNLGLEVAAICGKHFLKLEHLHYGYWANGLEIDIANLYIAQKNYTNFLVSHIPDGVKTILDVGCGTGQTAKELTGMGYSVDCVSPSSFLSERARSLLGESSRIFTCPFEKLETTHRYDLVLFSESFQYLDLQKGLEQTVKLLNDGGYMLICDVFKNDAEGKSVLVGGHKLTKFRGLIRHHPLELVVDKDITEQTAPNIDILDAALKNVLAPVLDSGVGFLTGRYPLTVKFLKWKYRKKINRIHEKYLSGGRSSEDFKRFKTYRLFLYRKTCPK
jgi:SAM-dependent methyltransferase